MKMKWLEGSIQLEQNNGKICKALFYQKVFIEVFALFEFFAISRRHTLKKKNL